MNHMRLRFLTIGLTLYAAILLAACGGGTPPGPTAQAGEWEGTGGPEVFKVTFTVAPDGNGLATYAFFYPIECGSKPGMEALLSETSVPLSGGEFSISSTNFSATAKFTAPNKVEGTWNVKPHKSPQLGDCRQMSGVWVAQPIAGKAQATAASTSPPIADATAIIPPSPSPATSVSRPKPGHWEGGSPSVSFDVTDQGKIRNFEMSLSWGLKGCSIHQTEDLAIDSSGVFLIGKADAAGKLDGNSIRGSFDSSTTIKGAYAATWFCENQVFSSSREGEWKAGWQGESISAAAPSYTRLPEAATPFPIAPIVVNGLNLQFVSANLQDTFTLGPGDTNVPHNAGDTLLVIEAKVLSGDLQKVTALKGEVFLTDETLTIRVPGISGSRTSSDQGNGAFWVFAVPKTARSFELHFPGPITVKLDPIVSGSPAGATPGAAQAVATPTRAVEIPPTAVAALLPSIPTQAATILPTTSGLQPPLQPFVCADARANNFTSGGGFNSGDQSWGSWGVESGEYYLRLIGENKDVWQTDGVRVSDGVFQVKTRADQAKGGVYGLLFGMDRLNDGRNFYAFVIDTNGQYALYRHTSQDWIELKKWTLASALNRGTQPNELRAVRSGPLIALFANGMPLTTTVYDSSYSGSLYAGLIAWSTEGSDGFTARFDDYTVCETQTSYPMPVNPMLNNTVTWKSGQAAMLSWTWLAAEEGLTRSFADQVLTTVRLDGTAYTGLKEYWSKPVRLPDGYGAHWSLPLPALAAGTHRVEFSVVAPKAISDGFDGDGDGSRDMYGPGEVFRGWVEIQVEP